MFKKGKYFLKRNIIDWNWEIEEKKDRSLFYRWIRWRIYSYCLKKESKKGFRDRGNEVVYNCLIIEENIKGKFF